MSTEGLRVLAAAAGVALAPLEGPLPQATPVPGAPAAAVVSVDKTGAALDWQKALDQLARAGVVAVGESHTSQAHHEAQAELVAELAKRTKVVVGLEMASYEDQAVLDGFMSGRMSETSFAAWWNASWGFDYLLYKPIFDAAKAARAPVKGLNAPRDVVKAVSAGGLASLSKKDRARLPKAVNESADERYKEYVELSITGFGHKKRTPAELVSMRQAMAVWNETMGEQAARHAGKGKVVVVIVGQGHVYYGAGVLESAARRGAIMTRAVLPYPLDGQGQPVAQSLTELRDPQNGLLELADWFRLLF